MSDKVSVKQYLEDIRKCGERIGELEFKNHQLQQENKILEAINNDLRKIYRNTYQKLFESGKDELANYFMAQIDDCPTFYVEPIIDYAKEWKDYKSRHDEVIELLKKNYIDP